MDLLCDLEDMNKLANLHDFWYIAHLSHMYEMSNRQQDNDSKIPAFPKHHLYYEFKIITETSSFYLYNIAPTIN